MKNKKVYGLFALVFLTLLLSMTFASASWLSNLFGGNSMTGNAITDNKTLYPIPIVAVKESVKCVFSNINTVQSCYSNKGNCSGIGTCVVAVSGKVGEQVTWKSSCGGYAYTLMDGQNDYAEFNCGTDVKESVKCVFSNINTVQSCYSNKGNCSGIGTCVVAVSGKVGEQVTWKSSCGGYAYTLMDGQNDYAEFNCGTDVKESVKCVFSNINTVQSCYSNKGNCSGIGTCVVAVSGKVGEQVTWKSSCGGYAYTLMDGQNDYAEFNCGTDVKESVKCVFSNINTVQSCYSNKGNCSGIGTCVVAVSGKVGEQVTWKSSCGGYAYTLMDGQNDYAEFNCGTIITPTTFYKAFWKCYDGYYIQATNNNPLASDTWNKYAQEDCKGHCYTNQSKCGVNSFGVL